MTLISKKNHQYITLLNILFQTSPTIDEVLDTFQVTRNTLISIIDSLNSNIAPASIQINKNRLYLSFDHSTSYDEIISSILKKTLEYNILLSIFFKETHSYLSLSEELFTSESTIRRNIKELNNSLSSLNIVIKANPFKLTGDEKNIRRLMVLIIKEVYGLDDLPFATKDINYLENIYNKAIHLLPKKRTVQDYNNFLLFAGVSFNRERLGHHYDGTKKTNLLITSILKIRSTISKSPYLPSIIDVENDELLVNTLSLFLSDDFALTTYNDKQIYTNQNFLAIHSFLTELNQLFDLNLSDNRLNEVNLELYDVVYGFLAITTPFPIVNTSYENFMIHGHTFMIDLNKFIKEVFKKHIDESFEHTYPFFYYILSTRLPELTHDFIKRIAKVNILIYINFDYQFSEYIKNKLSLIVPGELNFKLIRQREEFENQQLFEENDLIITNSFNLFADKYLEKIIKVSHFISKDDIAYINHQIINLYQKNAHTIINKTTK